MNGLELNTLKEQTALIIRFFLEEAHSFLLKYWLLQSQSENRTKSKVDVEGADLSQIIARRNQLNNWNEFISIRTFLVRNIVSTPKAISVYAR